MIQNIKKFLQKHFISIFILTLVIVFVFGELPKTFYQQDEWHGLGLILTGDWRSSLIGELANPLLVLFAKGRILSNGIYSLLLYLFPFENTPFAILAISLHVIATCLVYYIIYRFIKNKFFSLLGTLFFTVNAVSQGAITWSFVAISTVGSTILILVAIITFFKFVESQKSKFLLGTAVLIYISLFFKETGLYLFLFFPLAALLFKKYKFTPHQNFGAGFTDFIKKYWVMVVPFILIFLYRILELKLRTTSSNLYITGQNENFLSTIVLRSIFYPLTSFSLMFVPGDQFLSFSRTVLHQIYPFFSNAPNNPLIVQTVILDTLSIVLTFLILGLIFFFLQKEKPTNKKYIYFWLLFAFMSFLPYVVLSKDFSYLESRYYYLSVVGSAFLLAWLLKRLKESFRFPPFFRITLLVYITFLMLHAYVVYGKIQEQLMLSDWRENYIIQQKELVPKLAGNKNVFYITSDHNWWADTNMIPFQQGTGYTLMVMYYESGKIPKELLKEQFLFEIGSQGYKEIGGYGFGYFWDEKKLESAVKLHKIPLESIYRLFYNSSTMELNIHN